jgi:hypothetical protein
MTKLSIRRNWQMYCDIIFRDSAATPSKGGRAFSREFAHSAFYAGARSTLQVLAHMLERGELDELHRTIAQQGRQIRVIAGIAPQKRRH